MRIGFQLIACTMTEKNISKPYENLSIVYNRIMRKVNYEKWAEYIWTIAAANIDGEISALELGSGTCSFANILRRNVKSIVASDISSSMLFQSKDKKLKKICFDMSAIPLKKKFNLVISLFDSVNYLTSKKKFFSMLKDVECILDDNGIFTFDVSLEKNSYKFIKYSNHSGSVKNIQCDHQTNFNPKTRIHKNIFIIKFKDGKQIIETHKQKIYPFNFYFEVIEKTNLYVAECYRAFTFSKGSANSDRLQFILKKRKQDALSY